MSDTERDAPTADAAGELVEVWAAIDDKRLRGIVADAATALRELSTTKTEQAEKMEALQRRVDAFSEEVERAAEWGETQRTRATDAESALDGAKGKILTMESDLEGANESLAAVTAERDEALRGAASLSLDLGIDLPKLRLNHGFQVKKLKARIAALEVQRGTTADSIVALLDSSRTCPDCDLIARSDGVVVPSEHAKSCILADVIAARSPQAETDGPGNEGGG